MPKSKRSKGPTVRRKGDAISGTLYVTFRDPRYWQNARDRSKGRRVVRKSLKTADSKLGEKYVKFLSQVIGDKKLWKTLPKDTPDVIRQIWLGATSDFQIETENGQVSLQWSKNASRLEVDVPDDFVPVEGSWEPKGNPAGVRQLFVDNPEALSLAEEFLRVQNELYSTRESNGILASELSEVRNENTALRFKLSQFNRRAAKAASVGTLSEEAERYLTDYNKRKITNNRKGITKNTIERFVRDMGGDRKADELSEKELSIYIQGYRKKGKGKNSESEPISEERRKSIRGALCSFLESVTNGMFERKRVVTISAHSINREKSNPIWLTAKEADSLIAKIYEFSGEYWGDFAIIQLHTGFRPTEMTLLLKENINNKTISLAPIRDPKTGVMHAKTGSRSIGIHKNIAQIVARRASAGEGQAVFPFLSTRGEHVKVKRRNNTTGLFQEMWDPHVLSRRYPKILRAAAQAVGITKPIDSRTLRRSFASISVRSGLSTEEVATLLGNQPKVVRKHYGRLVSSEIDISAIKCTST